MIRLFQNYGTYPSYHRRLRRLTAGAKTFRQYKEAFLRDGYGAGHVLKPVLDDSKDCFYTNGDDERFQRLWAAEQGMPSRSALESILLAQVEHHRPDVFYNLDPMRYGGDFVKRLPGCVKASIAWRAAPSPGINLAHYSRVVCNFPSILREYERLGLKPAYFSPSHDPGMDPFAANTERPTDVLFVGGYSRHHRRRAELLESVAALAGELKIVFHLDRSRLTQLAELPFGRFVPRLRRHRRPAPIMRVSRRPIFGRELCRELSRAKIVLNGAVDMAGDDRGNMRCFEAMGCGALMVSDTGNYPAGMVDGETMLCYASPGAAVELVRQALAQRGRMQEIARRGYDLVRTAYSKSEQWRSFVTIVEGV